MTRSIADASTTGRPLHPPSYTLVLDSSRCEHCWYKPEDGHHVGCLQWAEKGPKRAVVQFLGER